MSAKEWLIVAAVAVVAFVGLWALQPARDVGRGDGPAPFVTPFDDVAVDPTRDAAGEATLLAIRNPDAATDPGSALFQLFTQAGGPLGQTVQLTQRSPFISLVPASLAGDHESRLTLNGHTIATLRAAEAGPRLFHDGYNATRVTAYIFDTEGLLQFTNANASTAERFELPAGGPGELPGGVWYLGEGETPEGFDRLPLAAQALLNQVRPLLDGLPVGGVATTQTNALVSFYGTLFVTVRIDELVLAP